MRNKQKIKCVLCEKEFDITSDTKPFCSKRCSYIDLNNWLGEKYSIHIIEPINELIHENCKISESFLMKNGLQTTCKIEWNNGLLTEFTSTGEESSQITFKYIGELSEIEKIFNNPYDCFKEALMNFCFSIKKKKRMFNINKLYRVLRIIELGIKE